MAPTMGALDAAAGSALRSNQVDMSRLADRLLSYAFTRAFFGS
ncbi:hypothetical protein SAMN05428979_2965 [Stappia sp. ES.058]|nr:hypothetical protein SAMN05428979_2965 [Stappia sp. ES.058]